jgi:tRNA 5-methylaminomethyl-2-thiouridine biosynthesis bifunctional protein
MPESTADKLQQATISWDAKGQPRATDFDDLYFSSASGLAETRYVFLHNNGLPQRWATFKRPFFTIGETGFGTGLNFLAVANHWLNHNSSGTLHFVSAEKYPLSRSDLQQALSLWPALSELASALIEQYPPPIPGIHRLYLANNRIVLTLLYGDANTMFASLSGSDHPLFSSLNNPVVNAWFLDGFAPAKNPQMWTDDLFQTLANLSGPGTTFSTFTAAGSVRRGLQAAGFEVQKVPGFGQKLHMLCGYMADPITPEVSETDWQPASRNAKFQPPWYLPPRLSPPASALVIGGGIAGCATARSLADRGISVTLIEQHPQLASEGSGNPQAILYPKLSSQRSSLSRFGLMALLHATRYHRDFLREEATGSPCGVLVLPNNSRDLPLFEELARQYPAELVTLVTGSPLDDTAGIPLGIGAGLFFPQLGWIKPVAVCRALTDHPLIHHQTAAITTLHHEQHQWQAYDRHGTLSATAPVAVIASGTGSAAFIQTAHLPLKPIRGQISCLPATADSKQLKTVICGEGYLAPASDGIHTLGATYNISETSTTVRAQDHRDNLAQLQKTAPEVAALFGPVDANLLDGRAAFRCTTPDYLPIAGPAPIAERYRLDYALLRKNARAHIPVAGACWPGLYLNCGHGSRGMSYAPLCAELLASQICGEMPPLERDLRQAIHPGRFIIRDMKRNRQ